MVVAPALTVRRGARIGILGHNGAGKSTLLRTLVGELPARGGEVVTPSTLAVGYLDQRHIESLRPDDSPLDHLRRLAPQEREPVLRGFLGGFGFSGDDAIRPVGPMSGGEKSRLGLALLAWRKPGFLVLDEPTNHLDPAARDALADALAAFEGALLLVSHDRYLLRGTVDTLLVVADGQVAPFDGDLDDYAAWLGGRGDPVAAAGTGAAGGRAAASAIGPRAGRSQPRSGMAMDPSPSRPDGQAASPPPGRSVSPPSAGDERRERAQQREALARLTRPVADRSRRIETLLARHQDRAMLLDRQLSDPGAFADPQAAAELARERAFLAGEIARLEDEWLECEAELERLRQ